MVNYPKELDVYFRRLRQVKGSSKITIPPALLATTTLLETGHVAIRRIDQNTIIITNVRTWAKQPAPVPVDSD